MIACVLLAAILAAGIGAVQISPLQILGMIFHKIGFDLGIPYDEMQETVFWVIRLPRVLLAVLIGATLAVCGVGMQGLFRNPLADPGLIGIGSGASLAAVITLVLGSSLLAGLSGQYTLNIMAFLGALASMIAVYRISRQEGKTNVAIMLLAGIAVNAMAGALTGLVTISANEQQLRSITFWSMGSLGGASWSNVLGILPFCALSLIGMPFFAKSLNALSLGESDAGHLGIRTERLKNSVMYLCAIGVGACVAVSGIIVFVGLVVPHILRMTAGPDHKKLIGASALGGAVLLTLADLVSRTIAAPVEIPIGIITSVVGGPFFLYLLMKEKKKQTLI